MARTISGHYAHPPHSLKLRTRQVPGRPITLRAHRAALPLFLRLAVLLDQVIQLRPDDTWSYCYRKPCSSPTGALFSDHAGWAIDVWTTRQGKVGFPGTLTKTQATKISRHLKKFHTPDGRYVFGWGVSDKIAGVTYPHTYHNINDPMHFFIRRGIKVADLHATRQAMNLKWNGTVAEQSS